MSHGTMDKIAEIEAEMARTQKNKATASHLGLLKAKLAKLKRELIEGPAGSGGGGKGDGFDVNKVGDARVGYVGFPSVGKSTLLTKLTGTFSEAAAYEFTTLTAVPGIVRYRGAKIQMLDLPGIIEGAKDGKGRGRQVIAAARTCDLILIVLDVLKPITHKKLIEHELEGFGIRLNKTPPAITVRKKDKGGITMSTAPNVSPPISLEELQAVCKEYRIVSADIFFRENNITIDEVVDVLEGRCMYIPCLYVMNKIDQITLEELNILDRMPNYVPICAFHEWNLDGLVEAIWEKLDLIRIYTKPKGKLPDYTDPVVLPRNRCLIEDFCNKIHKAFIKQLKHALVWGTSAKHRPQKVGKDHPLQDEDIVQLVKRI